MDLGSKENRGFKNEGFNNRMSNRDRIKKVAFIDENIKKAYESLKMGKHEEKQLLLFIDRVIDDLKKKPVCGTRIPSKLWP